jgi:hypothetical protein
MYIFNLAFELLDFLFNKAEAQTLAEHPVQRLLRTYPLADFKALVINPNEPLEVRIFAFWIFAPEYVQEIFDESRGMRPVVSPTHRLLYTFEHSLLIDLHKRTIAEIPNWTDNFRPYLPLAQARWNIAFEYYLPLSEWLQIYAPVLSNTAFAPENPNLYGYGRVQVGTQTHFMYAEYAATILSWLTEIELERGETPKARLEILARFEAQIISLMKPKKD